MLLRGPVPCPPHLGSQSKPEALGEESVLSQVYPKASDAVSLTLGQPLGSAAYTWQPGEPGLAGAVLDPDFFQNFCFGLSSGKFLSPPPAYGGYLGIYQ